MAVDASVGYCGLVMIMLLIVLFSVKCLVHIG